MQVKFNVYKAVIGSFEHYKFTQEEIDLLIASGHVFISKMFPNFGPEIYLCSPSTQEFFLREVVSTLTKFIEKKYEEDYGEPKLCDSFKKAEEMLNSPCDLSEYRNSTRLLLSQIQKMYKTYKKQERSWQEQLFKS